MAPYLPRRTFRAAARRIVFHGASGGSARWGAATLACAWQSACMNKPEALVRPCHLPARPVAEGLPATSLPYGLAAAPSPAAWGPESGCRAVLGPEPSRTLDAEDSTIPPLATGDKKQTRLKQRFRNWELGFGIKQQKQHDKEQQQQAGLQQRRLLSPLNRGLTPPADIWRPFGAFDYWYSYRGLTPPADIYRPFGAFDYWYSYRGLAPPADIYRPYGALL